MNEVERAFVVDSDLDVGPYIADATATIPLRQAYVAIDDHGPVELRLRQAGGTSLLTVKGGTGMIRSEVEFEIDEARANALWPLAGERVIEKQRHTVGIAGGHLAELDVYAGRFAGLVMVEVEFLDEATAVAFEPPDWFGTEVTDDARWGNANLARHGRPDRP
ncbi:MAG: CYTH domain-containing protein [Actinomycetota bacterium]